MNTIRIGLLALYSLLLVGAGPAEDNPRELRFVLGQSNRIFSFALGFDTQATVTFPVVCHEAIPSNLNLIAAALESRFSRSVMISAMPTARAGDRANVTVFCEDNLTVSLEVVVTPDSAKGAQTIELVENPEYTAREQLRIKEVEKRAQREFTDKLNRAKETLRNVQEVQMMRGMLGGLVVTSDHETAASEGLIVKVDKVIRIGEGRGYVQFRVHNLSGNRLKLRDVSVADDRTGDLLPGDFQFTTRSGALGLEHGEQCRALVGFDYPDFSSTFRLVVSDGAGISVVVKDIDF